MTIFDNANGNTKRKTTFAQIGEGRSTLWFLTINNYDSCTIETLKSENTKYLVFQSEKGKKNTPHIHAVIRYKNARSFSSMKKTFPRANIQRCRNFTKAREYCMKDRTFTGLRYERKDQSVILDINDNVVLTEQAPILEPGSPGWLDKYNITFSEYIDLETGGYEPRHWDAVLDVKPLKL